MVINLPIVKFLCIAVIAIPLTLPLPANAWGATGHKVVALIAQNYLSESVRLKVNKMLSTDTEVITTRDIGEEAVWADMFRDSDRGGMNARYRQTRYWHFVDIELDEPNIDSACFDHPGLPPNTPASQGPAEDCIIDKIDQFESELARADTAPEERLLALKFLLHFVGDVHQPLHTSDHHDAGGNGVRVGLAGGTTRTSLHQFWDDYLVSSLGKDPELISRALVSEFGQERLPDIAHGTPKEWAWESFLISSNFIYAKLPKPDPSGVRIMDPEYVNLSKMLVKQQLFRAGVRLANMLNIALANSS